MTNGNGYSFRMDVTSLRRVASRFSSLPLGLKFGLVMSLFTLLIALTTSAVSYVRQMRLLSDSERSIRETLHEEARLYELLSLGLKEPLMTYDYDRQQSFLREMGSLGDVIEVTIHSSRGEPLYRLVKRGGQAEVVSRPSGGEIAVSPDLLAGKSSYQEQTLQDGGKTALITVPIATDETLWGIVSMTVDMKALAGLESATRSARVSALLFAIAQVALLLALALLVGLYLGRTVVGRITRIAESMNAAGSGDFSIRIPPSGGDELGRLAGTFNDLMDRVSTMVGKLTAASAGIAAIAEKVDAAANGVAEGADDQKRAVGETEGLIGTMAASIEEIDRGTGELAGRAAEASASMLEMASSIRETAGNMQVVQEQAQEVSSSITEVAGSVGQVSRTTAEVVSSAEEMRATARAFQEAIRIIEESMRSVSQLADALSADAARGEESVSLSRDGFGRARETFQNLETSIRGLTEMGQGIESVLRTIDDIADQVNLLALNAAILAAQAGEHGRGFTVLAGEIKALAGRTSLATRDISSVLRTLVTGARDAAAMSRAGADAVDEAFLLIGQSGEMLMKVQESTARVRDRVLEVFGETAKQSTGSRQITDAASSLAERIRQVATATEELAGASKLIDGFARRMDEISREVNRSLSEQAAGSTTVSEAIASIVVRADRMRDAVASVSSKSRDLTGMAARVGEIGQEHHGASEALIVEATDLLVQAKELSAAAQAFRMSQRAAPTITMEDVP
jgi:methyl-accepting chemotaxis protein